MKKTYQPKHTKIQRKWHLIDAKDEVLGRLSTRIAGILMGKNKTDYAPHIDMGDYIVVINAGKVEVTGRKRTQKVYYRHSGYPGGFRELTFNQLMEKDPTKVIKKAVHGMMPTNRLHKKRMARLKVFAGERHDFSDKFKNN